MEKQKTCAIPTWVFVHSSDIIELLNTHLVNTKILVSGTDGERYTGYLTKVGIHRGFDGDFEFLIEEFPEISKIKQND